MPFNQEKGQWEASPGGCQEQADLPGATVYFPCDQPAVRVVQAASGEGPYRMCERHADHNIRNRRFTDLGPFENKGVRSSSHTPETAWTETGSAA